MRAVWLGLSCLLPLAGLLLRATVMDMCQREIRARLAKLPDGLIRIGIGRLPREWREDFSDEWLAELDGIRRETRGTPVTGLVREVLFALGLLICGHKIVREFTGGVSRLAAAWVLIRGILLGPDSATRRLARSRPGLSAPSATPGASPGGALSLRWPVAVMTIVALASATAVYALQAALTGKGARPHHAVTLPAVTLPAPATTVAVTWILHQVSRDAVVSCDAQVCRDLANGGFPSANLLTVGTGSNDPVGSDLVVATADIRAQFGGRLASVYAPAVIASFGSGSARIDIRLVPPGGAKGYYAVEQAALRARKAADAQVLADSNVKLSATARAQLLGGEIDPRLPLLIVPMAAGHPLRIVDICGRSPGGGPANLLRWVDLATAIRAAHLTRAAYVRWMRAFIAAQPAQYHPAWAEQITLPDGQTVLRIGYGAPSPLE